jgi:hypothetical protein
MCSTKVVCVIIVQHVKGCKIVLITSDGAIGMYFVKLTVHHSCDI